MSDIFNIVKTINQHSKKLLSFSEVQRKTALKNLSEALLKNQKEILLANLKDLELAKTTNLSPALLERLSITEKSILQLSNAGKTIAESKNLVGVIEESSTRIDGLQIEKQRIPLGVIALIFESRPNVLIDAVQLAIKSGNALILKGGKEAHHSNTILFNIVLKATEPILGKNIFHLLHDREDIDALLKLNKYVDLVIPRGGEKLVQYVKSNTTIPVIAHDRGLCHLYIHEDADQKIVESVVINAKCHRFGVCNALESLLIHNNYPGTQNLLIILQKNNIEMRVSPDLLNSNTKPATPADYHEEWLAPIISIKTVPSLNAAIDHIQIHGSRHTDGIISKSPKAIETFINHIDSSCIPINSSTRFNDGGELGLGAELGISTSKIHVYGPMGAKDMTTTRFILRGDGHIRK